MSNSSITTTDRMLDLKSQAIGFLGEIMELPIGSESLRLKLVATKMILDYSSKQGDSLVEKPRPILYISRTIAEKNGLIADSE